MKRILFAVLLVMLLASAMPVHAAGGPRDRRHPRRDWRHQPTCATQAAQSAAYAWMNGLRGIGGAAYTARFRDETLRLAQAEPRWFQARMKRAARLNDRGRTRRAIGVIWSALERPCQ